MTKSEKVLFVALKENGYEDSVEQCSGLCRAIESAMEKYAEEYHKKKLRIKNVEKRRASLTGNVDGIANIPS